jgi:hypothetical protein
MLVAELDRVRTKSKLVESIQCDVFGPDLESHQQLLTVRIKTGEFFVALESDDQLQQALKSRRIYIWVRFRAPAPADDPSKESLKAEVSLLRQQLQSQKQDFEKHISDFKAKYKNHHQMIAKMSMKPKGKATPQNLPVAGGSDYS